MSTKLDRTTKDFLDLCKTHTTEGIGTKFITYVVEAAHSGWDGCTTKDKTAIAQFLQDFVTWAHNDPNVDPVIYTGAARVTLDRPRVMSFPKEDIIEALKTGDPAQVKKYTTDMFWAQNATMPKEHQQLIDACVELWQSR